MVYKETKLNILGKNNFKIKKVKCINTGKYRHAKLYNVITVASADSLYIKKQLKSKIFKCVIVGINSWQKDKTGVALKTMKNCGFLLKQDKALRKKNSFSNLPAIKILNSQKFFLRIFT